MSDTIALDRSTWDLFADVDGNIAAASAPYSVAQDVASAVRLFLGELWYDTTQGVPYFEQILGWAPPLSLFKQLIVNAAQTVPGCNNAVVYITGFAYRALTGQIQFTDNEGVQQAVSF